MEYIKWIGHGGPKFLTTGSVDSELGQVLQLFSVFGKLLVELFFVFGHFPLILLSLRFVVRLLLVAYLLGGTAHNIG